MHPQSLLNKVILGILGLNILGTATALPVLENKIRFQAGDIYLYGDTHDVNTGTLVREDINPITSEKSYTPTFKNGDFSQLSFLWYRPTVLRPTFENGIIGVHPAIVDYNPDGSYNGMSIFGSFVTDLREDDKAVFRDNFSDQAFRYGPMFATESSFKYSSTKAITGVTFEFLSDNAGRRPLEENLGELFISSRAMKKLRCLSMLRSSLVDAAKQNPQFTGLVRNFERKIHPLFGELQLSYNMEKIVNESWASPEWKSTVENPKIPLDMTRKSEDTNMSMLDMIFAEIELAQPKCDYNLKIDDNSTVRNLLNLAKRANIEAPTP